MLTIRSSLLICLSAAGLAFGVLLKQEAVALTSFGHFVVNLAAVAFVCHDATVDSKVSKEHGAFDRQSKRCNGHNGDRPNLRSRT